MKIADIEKGDLIVYKNGKTNYVNKPFKYEIWFNSRLENVQNHKYDIAKVKRYVKFLCFYRLKTIYKRKEI